VQLLCLILDFFGLAHLLSPCGPTVYQGLGAVAISADTAWDADTPEPTELFAHTGAPLLSFNLGTRWKLRPGRTVILTPPPGFVFVGTAPAVSVGAGRSYDATTGESENVNSIGGTVGIDPEGRLVWTCIRRPTWSFLTMGDSPFTIAPPDELFIQPITGETPEQWGGEITAESDAFMVTGAKIESGLGSISLTPGKALATKSSVLVIPASLPAGGSEFADVEVRVMDQFGTLTDEGSVDLTDQPKLGSFESAASRVAVGSWTSRYSSPDPGIVEIGADLNASDVIDSQSVDFFGVDLRLGLNADNNEAVPPEDPDLWVTVTNESAHDATGVEVRATLPIGWSFFTILSSEAGTTSTDDSGPNALVFWKDVMVPAGGSVSVQWLLAYSGQPGTAVQATVQVTASDIYDNRDAHTGSGDLLQIDYFM
jgi:uncharacterized protein DUF11